MQFYLPLPALDRPGIKESIDRLPSSIVTKPTLAEDKSPQLCSTSDTIEVQHNTYIQQKYFKTRLYRFSKPVYIWSRRPTQIHLSKSEYTNGKKVELLNVTLNATTNDQFEGLFHIIEFSYWTKKSVKPILTWIAHNYNALVQLRLRVIRLPEVTKNGALAPGFPPIPPTNSLLCLGSSSEGSVRRTVGTIRYKYYIWNGSNRDVANALTHIRDNYLKTKVMVDVLGSLLDTHVREIGTIVTRIEQHLNPPDESSIVEPIEEEGSTESSDDSDSTGPVDESDSTEPFDETTSDTTKLPDLTAASIIAQLGPVKACDLATSIIALAYRAV